MKLYWHYLSLHVRSILEYRKSFILVFIGQFLISFSAFLTILFLFNRFNQVQGFTVQETLMCFGIINFAFAFAECFARGFDQFGQLLGNGKYDRILTRPRNVIFQVLATTMGFTRFGRLLQAIVIIVVTMNLVNVHWTLFRLFILLSMILCAILIYFALFLIFASLCFYTTENLEFMNIFTDGSREFAAYPLGVYGKEILRLLTFIVPIACVQYYPFLYLLGKSHQLLYAFAPWFAPLLLIPAFLLWRIGNRHYISTGS